MTRHADFERIKKEFENYYCKGAPGPCPGGEKEYYTWLHALQLDETLCYGQTKESFSWAKENIHFVREDPLNKYYEVLVGFPVESMNGNVYAERDLIAAALTLEGIHPDLNHKPEFWFSPENPQNKWGVLTVTGAKYEDGAVEVMLQVPKDAVCPICNGRKMVDLIDEHKIVNVSLIGGCKVSIDSPTGAHLCHGFSFDKQGFTLLTSDVLPGIPMARIFPMEAYLPFSRARHKYRVKIVGLENMKKEALEPLTGGTTTPPTQTKPDGNMQCPKGTHYNSDLDACIPNDAVPTPGEHTPEGVNVVTGKEAGPDNSGVPLVNSHVKLTAYPAVHSGLTQHLNGQGMLEELRRAGIKNVEAVAKTCEAGDFDACVAAVMADGKDEESAKAICAVQCAGGEGLGVGKQALELNIALETATKENARAEGLEKQLVTFRSAYTTEKDARLKLEGRAQELARRIQDLETTNKRLTDERVEFEARMRKRDVDLQEAQASSIDYKRKLEDTLKENQEINTKYRATLQQNMQLTKKLTENNEEWLRLTKENDGLQERLKQAKRLGKRISVHI
jgi:hypothetical protein